MAMPDHTRVVVVGGGIVGASVLYHLAKEGWTDALLIEKAEFTSGSTWHAAGAAKRKSIAGRSLLDAARFIVASPLVHRPRRSASRMRASVRMAL